ncbi:TonB-dependent receptor plug domain-containing protein [Shewanella fidelis]|uniref:TonB-dependent receptor plug domain-containing protein n=1 Tax=Shewanella fidelis TaxID=173509 RepID=UPI00048CC6C0|nr:TonB-dependent receptor plug domain-containing protein [Shewanella fidelis]
MNTQSKLRPKMLAVSIFIALSGGNVSAGEAVPQLAETQAVHNDSDTNISIERTEITNTPVGNTDLSSLLARESSVGVDTGLSGMRGGDLTPEQISIAGARPHQTQYMIGGVSTNNITTAASNKGNSGTLSSGHPSGYYVDTALMEEVEVLDKNINPEYGGFTGGVVNVELRKAKDEFQAEYQYRMTDSDWNAEPETSAKDKGFADGSFGDGRYQPNYQKRFHTLHVSGAITENQKLAVNYSRKDSEIPLSNNGVTSDYGQSIDNLFVTHELDLGQWQLQSDLRYSKFVSKDFLNDSVNQDAAQANSDSSNEHLGLGGTIKLSGNFQSGTWQTTFAYDQLEDNRQSEADYFRTNIVMPVDGAMLRENTGGYGDLSQVQDTWQVKSLFEFTPMYIGNSRHQLMMGAEFISQNAKQERHSDFSAFNYMDVRGKKSISNWSHYQKGTVEVDSQRYALFANNQMTWDQLTLNLGARAEQLAQFDKTVFAPRLNVSWDFDQEQMNRLTLGVNRYYSNDQLGWELRQAAKSLETKYSVCMPINGDYSSNSLADYSCTARPPVAAVELNTADVPYSDELSLNWQYEVAGLSINPSYMLRQQKAGLSISGDEVLNNVESESQIFALNIHNTQAWQAVGARLDAFLNVTYENRSGSGNLSANYDDVNDLNSGYENTWVMFDGQLMRSNDMDTSGFSSPWEARLGTTMTWESWGVTWSNLINFEDGRNLTQFMGMEQANIDGEIINVKAIDTAKMESLITWDTSVRWSPEALIQHHASVELSVTNLLDSHAEITSYGTNVNGKDNTSSYYNKGREVWLALTLKY